MTQIMDLMLLAPRIQERVLVGTIDAHERSLRVAMRSQDWQTQSAAISVRSE
jgi:hypothetical protein